MPKVSVIIPLYNKEMFIRRSLNSIFNQTYNDFEVIVVDDGSTDNGLSYVYEYQDLRLRIIEQENLGPGAARNRGIRDSRGEYVAFLDADDEWVPEFLQEVMKTFDEYRNSVVVTGWIYSTINNEEVNIRNTIKEKYNLSINGKWKIDFFHDIKNNITAIPHLFCTNTVVFEKIIGKKYNFFSEVNNYGEDWYLWICLAFNHEIIFLNKVLAIVHSHDSGIRSIGKKDLPLQCYFINYKNIINFTKFNNRKLLKKLFILLAIEEANIRFGSMNRQSAIKLMKMFPQMIFYSPLKTIFLYIKFLFPKYYILKNIIKIN